MAKPKVPRSRLVKELSLRTGLLWTDVEKLLDAIPATVIDFMEAGHKDIRIKGLGGFRISKGDKPTTIQSPDRIKKGLPPVVVMNRRWASFKLTPGFKNKAKDALERYDKAKKSNPAVQGSEQDHGENKITPGSNETREGSVPAGTP